MTLARPFPAVVFESVSVAATPVLPRMDIAAFVGFASSGPLHTPIAIEDPAEFREVFGEPPVLAWDPQDRTWQRACLGAAVDDFFAQGGQRCWVVRVASERAVTNTFAVPGLVRAADGGGGRPEFVQASALARSPGSWSDGLLVSAVVQRDALVLHGLDTFDTPPLSRPALTVAPFHGRPLRAGDLVHVTFDGPRGVTAYLEVESVQPAGVLDAGRWQRISGRAHWLEPLAVGAPVEGNLTLDGVAVAGTQTLSRVSETELELTGLTEDTSVLPGALLRLSPSGGGHDYFAIAGEQRNDRLGVRGAWRYGPPQDDVGRPVLAARVSMGLSAREGEDRPGIDRKAWFIGDLGFVPGSARYWASLPDDATLYADGTGLPQDAAPDPFAEIWPEAARPRFPFAGSDAGASFLPLGLEGVPYAWGGADSRAGDALERDGLVPGAGESWPAFTRSLFLDPRFADLDEYLVMPTYTDLRYRAIQEAGDPPLRGLHSMLHLEEVSMVALPDAAARGWQRVLGEAAAPEQPTDEDAPADEAPCPGHELFLPCEDEGPQAIAPEPLAPAFATPPGRRWELIDASEFEEEGLLAIHRAALRAASARADMLAVLGLPLHFDAPAAIAFRRLLTSDPGATYLTPSYGALYHPWYHARGRDGLRRTSAEGAIAGIMASRANTRGAWVAPANEVVRPALALAVTPTREARDLLYDAGVNQIVPSARGPLLMGADTLTADRDLQPIGVRRLLILLRRLALREGRTYAFEPNSPAFRRRVAVAFQRVLEEMFKRGAFAGREPSEAFRVNTGDGVNTRESIEAGRFIVELKVAPSQPMTFITVRLVQTGPDTLTLVEAF